MVFFKYSTTFWTRSIAPNVNGINLKCEKLKIRTTIIITTSLLTLTLVHTHFPALIPQHHF